ncbi:MAG: peptide MFS transporter [Bdellovibrionaceae bacterium]|nr:peptide MFS transporter [Pseudobdellovibrionaceae bacterium]
MQTPAASPKTFFGHPRGLFILFLTEMWERFSYYGMRALLVLYMTKVIFFDGFDISKIHGLVTLKAAFESVLGPLSAIAISSQIYGLYTGLVYLTPFFGGLIADRYIGARRAVYVGGVLMAIGHFLMAFESLFLYALLFLILGNGFFKPNISTQVGDLYTKDDPRRDRAFTLFYMGINLGALLSPLVCGTLGEKVGWHYGFTAAGVGMMIGLAVYHLGRRQLPLDHLTKEEVTDQPAGPLDGEDYKRIAALILLCVVNILFWGVYEQQGNILQIWSDRNVDWNVLGWTVPSTWFQAINPTLIIAFAPLLNRLWDRQNKKGREPNSVTKMGLGCLLCALAYVLMFLVARNMGEGVLVSPLWMIATVGLFTLGELYLSPIGLSLVTKVAPVKVVSMMMGLWFMSSFFGNYLAGYLGMYFETLGEEKFFLMLAGLVMFGAVLFFISSKPLKRIIHGPG